MSQSQRKRWRKKSKQNPNGTGNAKQRLKPQKRGRGKLNGNAQSASSKKARGGGNQQPVYVTKCGLRVQLKPSRSKVTTPNGTNKTQRAKRKRNRSKSANNVKGVSRPNGGNRNGRNTQNSGNRKGSTNNGQRPSNQQQPSKSGKRRRRKQKAAGLNSLRAKRSANMSITMRVENDEAMDPYHHHQNGVQSMVSYPNGNVHGEEMVTVTMPRSQIQSILGQTHGARGGGISTQMKSGRRDSRDRDRNRNGSTLHERFAMVNSKRK